MGDWALRNPFESSSRRLHFPRYEGVFPPSSSFNAASHLPQIPHAEWAPLSGQPSARHSLSHAHETKRCRSAYSYESHASSAGWRCLPPKSPPAKSIAKQLDFSSAEKSAPHRPAWMEIAEAAGWPVHAVSGGATESRRPHTPEQPAWTRDLPRAQSLSSNLQRTSSMLARRGSEEEDSLFLRTGFEDEIQCPFVTGGSGDSTGDSQQSCTPPQVMTHLSSANSMEACEGSPRSSLTESIATLSTTPKRGVSEGALPPGKMEVDGELPSISAIQSTPRTPVRNLCASSGHEHLSIPASACSFVHTCEPIAECSREASFASSGSREQRSDGSLSTSVRANCSTVGRAADSPPQPCDEELSRSQAATACFLTPPSKPSPLPRSHSMPSLRLGTLDFAPHGVHAIDINAQVLRAAVSAAAASTAANCAQTAAADAAASALDAANSVVAMRQACASDAKAASGPLFNSTETGFEATYKPPAPNKSTLHASLESSNQRAGNGSPHSKVTRGSVRLFRALPSASSYHASSTATTGAFSMQPPRGSTTLPYLPATLGSAKSESDGPTIRASLWALRAKWAAHRLRPSSHDTGVLGRSYAAGNLNAELHASNVSHIASAPNYSSLNSLDNLAPPRPSFWPGLENQRIGDAPVIGAPMRSRMPHFGGPLCLYPVSQFPQALPWWSDRSHQNFGVPYAYPTWGFLIMPCV